MRKGLQEINKNSWQTTFVSDNLGKIKAGVQVVKSNCSTCWGEKEKTWAWMDLKSWLIWLMGLVKSSLWYTCAHVEQEVWLVVWTCSIGDYCFSLFLSWRHPTPCRHSFCIWRWNCFTQPWIAGIHLIVTTNFKMCLFKFRNLDTKIILKIWFNLLVTEKMVWPGTHQPSVRKSKLVYNSKYSIPVHLFSH